MRSQPFFCVSKDAEAAARAVEAAAKVDEEGEEEGEEEEEDEDEEGGCAEDGEVDWEDEAVQGTESSVLLVTADFAMQVRAGGVGLKSFTARGPLHPP
jgi:rRNA maturation endonuclease Nob1